MSRRSMLARIPGLRASIAIATAVVLVGIGTTVSFASYTASTAKSGTVTAATASLSATGITALAATYKSGLPGVSAAVLTDTAPVSVANTGSAPLAYALTSSGGDATLGPQIALQVWKAAATCDAASVVAANATSGTLAAPPALPSDANSAAAGATLALCFRTSVASGFTSTASTTPTISVVGTVGTNWTATAAGSFTQSTAFNWYEIVHGTSGKCLDSNGGGASAGTGLILYTCKPLSTTSNQSFRFAQVGATSMYRIYIGAGTTTGPVVAASSAATGAGVQLAAIELGNTTNSNNQQWSVIQFGSAGDFRIVLKGTAAAQNSLCLTASASVDLTPFTVTTCGTSTATTNTTYRAQRFSFTEVP